MFLKALFQIVGLADVEGIGRSAEDVDVEGHGGYDKTNLYYPVGIHWISEYLNTRDLRRVAAPGCRARNRT